EDILTSAREWLDYIWSSAWPNSKQRYPGRNLIEYDFLDWPGYQNALGLAVGNTIITHLEFLHNSRDQNRRRNPQWIAELDAQTNQYIEHMLEWFETIEFKAPDGGLNTILLELVLIRHPIMLSNLNVRSLTLLRELSDNAFGP